VFNVASGQSVAIRELLQELCGLAGTELNIAVDPALVRLDDPPEIVGDASALHEATDWSPSIDLRRTLLELLAEAVAG
jgi:GDP-4-dehydro-6-deoxy-D-mannose reductase